jgi:hypothetical protein
MLTETFLIYGQPEAPPELIPLRAGPLTMLYDPTSGFVRRIKLGEREVLRGIYAAVRDRNWGTVLGVTREVIRKIEPQSFHIEFESEHRQGDIHFVWRGCIRGDADGMLRYEFDGEARTTFLRNRIGFCVLHPIHECAGTRARQRRFDGTDVECRFPELIEPQIFGRSSFRDLRSITHEVGTDIWAQVEFEGDTFELEDQRNWTDASFKTYCTPLALPFPVEVKQGSSIRQIVTLKLIGDPANFSAKLRVPAIEVSSPQSEILTLTVPLKPTSRLPAIGLGVSSHGEPLSETELSALRQLGLDHLRADVRLGASDASVTLERAMREASQLNARVELALQLPRKGEVDPRELLRVLKQPAAPVARILALREGEPATSPATLAWVRKHFGSLGARVVAVGAGSDCNFCELNREQALGRLALAEADFLFWSVNPQVHATDHLSLMETLEAQGATVRSARAFAGDRPLIVSPVTLKQRFNPVATGAEPAPHPTELPAPVDPRQLSHFTAAWTIGSIIALAAAGVESVTLYETTGWRGVMEMASGSPNPERFPSTPGLQFPVFEALSHIAGHRLAALAPAVVTNEVIALGLFHGAELSRILVANLTRLARVVRFVGPGVGERCLQLKPYEVISLKLGDGIKK